ncbi:hypothetical protein K2X33_15050 [bacterium]|nr:hypothetical protein [bacterium]
MKKMFLALAIVVSIFASPARAAEPNVYTLNAGLAFTGGMVGPSVGATVAIAPVNGHEFYVGLEGALDFFFPGGVIMLIEILPTAWYQFAIPNHKSIRLVGGLSLGPAIGIGNALGYLGSGAYFEFLFRPGVILELASGTELGIDLKMGVIGSAFAFKPTANLVYNW